MMYGRHQVACILADVLGDTCACNFSGIDEWLPDHCDFAEKECPNVVGVACWEQYLKHRDEPFEMAKDLPYDEALLFLKCEAIDLVGWGATEQNEKKAQLIFDKVNAVDVAIGCVEKVMAIEENIKGLREDCDEAYKLNDMIMSDVLMHRNMTKNELAAESFALRMMQELSWLIGILEREDE